MERFALRPERVRRELVHQLLADPASEHEVVRDLSWRQVDQADFHRRIPSKLDAIRGFEDCYWLFESSPLNYALSQLRLDEAACLYRRVAALSSPCVAEVGRYKGGTTLLLAAAGAHVLSVDNDDSGHQAEFDEALALALGRLGLDERVEAIVADGQELDVDPESLDLVLLHCSPDYDLTWGMFRHWWPAVKPEGSFAFHVTPELPGEARAVQELQHDPSWPDLVFEPEPCGELVYARKTRSNPPRA